MSLEEEAKRICDEMEQQSSDDEPQRQPQREPEPAYDPHAFAPPKDAPKGKAKKMLSEKQKAHLTRIRTKALESKRLKKEEKDRLAYEKRRERDAVRADKEEAVATKQRYAKQKKEQDDDDKFNSRMDSWYAKKQERKAKKKSDASKVTAKTENSTTQKPQSQNTSYNNPRKSYDPFGSGFGGSGRRKIDQFGRWGM